MSILPGAQIAFLVLAAGGGSRLGGGKLVLPWRGKAIVTHTLEHLIALGLQAPLFVVTGSEADKVEQVIATEIQSAALVRVLENPDWPDGQSTSLRVGIAAISICCECRQIKGVVVALGDQPLVGTGTLDRLITAHLIACANNPEHPATAPSYQGRRGNPVILSPVLFPKIAELHGDVGARDILSRLGDALLVVPVDDPGVVLDIDTREEYAALPE